MPFHPGRFLTTLSKQRAVMDRRAARARDRLVGSMLVNALVFVSVLTPRLASISSTSFCATSRTNSSCSLLAGLQNDFVRGVEAYPWPGMLPSF